MFLTSTIVGEELETGMVLVGEAGGLSEVYDVSSPDEKGTVSVETEHGTLLLDASEEYLIKSE